MSSGVGGLCVARSSVTIERIFIETLLYEDVERRTRKSTCFDETLQFGGSSEKHGTLAGIVRELCRSSKLGSPFDHAPEPDEQIATDAWKEVVTLESPLGSHLFKSLESRRGTVAMPTATARLSGIGDYNAQHGTNVVIQQCKYLNNIVEQDHRAVKRITRPIQAFKDFRCARIILSGVELMHMIRKGQMRDDGRVMSSAQQFYLLAK
jgi:hypothetical protein